MKSQLFTFIFCLFLSFSAYSQASEDSTQVKETSKLFRSTEILPIRLEYSNLEVDKKTNDSTYLKTDLSYQQQDGTWKSFEIKMRGRGNFRRENCFFTPIKVKIKKSKYKNTLFDKNKELKFVLPCKKEKEKNDNVINEYLAYKLFEIISPYHFKTRLIQVDYTEIKKHSTDQHQLKGFIIEDIQKVAKRHDGDVYKKSIHPLNLDALLATRVELFQYLISNTDFATGYQHNGKVIFADKKLIPIPYDFDMSGLVNASYSSVSVIQSEELAISNVTQRMYRGFKRGDAYLHQVRQEFIDNKENINKAIERLEPYYENPKKFKTTKKYIAEFYKVIENDKRFKREIVDKLRTP